MANMKQQGAKPGNITNGHPGSTQVPGHKQVSVLRLSAGKLLPLHFYPELAQVQYKKPQDNDTQDKHILRSPSVKSESPGFYSPGIRYRPPRFQVLQVQDQGKSNVYDKTQRQNRYHDLYQGIGPHEPCNGIISFLAPQDGQVGCYMKRKEQDQKSPVTLMIAFLAMDDDMMYLQG